VTAFLRINPVSDPSNTRLSLISRIRGEDGAAWTELVDLYSPLVTFWCRRQGISDSDLQDLNQEVFFAVSRSIDRYQPSGHSGSFRGWLWGLARHKLIDAVRRRQRSLAARGGSTALQVLQNVPEDLVETDQDERLQFSLLVHRALEQVRSEFEPKSWQAFWRTTVEGLSVANVAAEMDLSSATIRQHRSRILRRLRSQLGEID
jgi:RNA polymerase sigma-70 factor (ECF subfamily)